MSQLVDLLFKQITLGRFKLETSCPQFTDDSFEPVKMFLWGSTEDNNVIQVDNAPIQVQLTKAGFHQPLEGCMQSEACLLPLTPPANNQTSGPVWKTTLHHVNNPGCPLYWVENTHL